MFNKRLGKITKRIALLILILLTISTLTTAQSRNNLFVSFYYAFDSYQERVFSFSGDQVTLGWAEIRNIDGKPTYTQYWNPGQYGVPNGAKGLIEEYVENE